MNKLKTKTRYILNILISVSISVSVATTADQVAGIDVELVPPAGFSPATAFAGFQQIQSFSTIEVRELETPFDTIVMELTPQSFAEESSRIISKQILMAGQRDAILFELEAVISGADFNKWLLIIGDEYLSISITAVYPRFVADTLGEPLKQSLLTAQWLRSEREQLFYDLPFTAAETTDLKFSKRSPNTVKFTDESTSGPLTAPSPSIVIGHLNSETQLIDIKEFSHHQLKNITSLEIETIVAERETRIDGIRSYEIDARARLVEGGNPVLFKQILAFQPYKYLFVHSLVEESVADRYRPQFDEVVQSIQFKKPR